MQRAQEEGWVETSDLWMKFCVEERDRFERNLERQDRWHEEQACLEEEEWERQDQLYKVTLPHVRKVIERYRKNGSIHAFEGKSLIYSAYTVADEGWLTWEERAALREIQQRLDALDDEGYYECEPVFDDPSSKWDDYDVLLPTDRELLALRKKYRYHRLSHGKRYKRWLSEHRLQA